MPIHVPMVDVHTIGAGGGSIASVDAAGMLQVGPESAGARPGPDLLRPRRHASPPSPTPTWCSAGSIPTGCWRVDQPVTAGPCARHLIEDKSAAPLGLDADRGGRRRSCASPTTAWPAPSAWCRCRAATTRATSRCSPSAARARCTPRRWRASSASRGAGAGAARHHQCAGLRRRRPAPRLRQHRQPAARRRSTMRRCAGIYAEQAAQRQRDDRRKRAWRCASCAACCSADMQFQGQSHILLGRRRPRRHRRRGPAPGLCRRLRPPLRHRAGGDPAGPGQSPYRGDRRAAGDLARGARGHRTRAHA